MRNFFYIKIVVFVTAPILLFGFVFLNTEVSAQMSEREIAEQEAKLRAEYDQLQKEIQHWQGVLTNTRQKASTIQGDISILNAKIKEAELTIRAKTIAINGISSDISDKTAQIGELEGRLDKGKESLAQLIRKTNELDNYSLAEFVFANRNISDFFEDLNTFTSIKRAMKSHFEEMRQVKSQTEIEKEKLNQKKNQEIDAKYVVESNKKVVAQSEAEKKKLLNATKQEEKSYQQILAEREARAAQIRAALFRLRDTDGIPFGKALEYAEVASAKTGVRSALILAILSQESDLGRNQGSCLITNLETGDGAGKNTGTPFERVMFAPRDTAPFESITKRLGMDWKMTPISCPPGAKYFSGRGFGGGMGPSQFIPSTWELFKSRIGPAVGVSPDQADPWNPAHSFVATGIYLADRGANAGTYTAERNAACRYYSGAACTPGRVPANVFYGDSVMKKVEEIQENINFLKGI